ncbi:MAG TPA: winged helix-turn-helix transcriptional regulator [Candidatus Nitrosotenuis sp.]|nr:winged helix-turn-helix transcriptional regulator [Candidatus Nitrosotenuis sp.]
MDKLDIEIMHLLLDNCRESDRQIGNKIGISGAAVKSRIKKMIQNGMIENFTLKIEPPVLGYNLLYIVITGQDIDEILKQVGLIGDPFLVVPCVGGITVCGIVVKENVQQKIEIMKNLMKGVRVLSIFEAVNPGVRSDLIKTDLEIINQLMKNPIMRIDELAKSTKLSTKTVARSLKKLQNDEAIQFTLIYNPAKFDQYIPFAVLAWIDGSLNETLNVLKKEFSDYFLQKPFIAKNQIVLFLYSNNIFELDNITHRVRNVKGVSSADLFIPKKIELPQRWIKDTIKSSKSSGKLHLLYQTN